MAPPAPPAAEFAEPMCTLPVLPLVTVPELRRTAPDTASDTPSASPPTPDSRVNSPELEAVFDPVVIVTAPPVVPGEAMAPADRRMSPPKPAVPEPTVSSMLPPLPEAVPDTK
jgi:hypothetical protein